ncbi:PREDICTED: uncharacterized protein LOC105569530 [Vollenhovia emeryi]|uniref:uncharacterized protein LOC105569530 n=1 Tax=Vollenhovia emeryi TaxID=411798 RepID=UPI0005F57D4D|nr:PREDICTED: uncharacterized protein LOC105569530 [Vollenhovia emeryi]XP_011881450.1 PREDICTED: uncharacterized protein LOC105569530 [Vollenhovia emeryi]XP_011881451.1 PREDICTED: uncharacterized protein LOC105569530 [Vollenhovia emeryi]
METVSRLLLVLILNRLWAMTGYAAPLLDAKKTWNRNVLAPVIKTACSSDGQCWGWLPISERYNIIPREDDDISRLLSRRHVASPVPEITLRSWRDGTLEEPGREIRASLATSKQMPTKMTKKDVFVSRSWGAGGMPFSVLYMNPHGPRSNHAVATTSTSQRQDSSATTESSMSFAEHSRIGSRNGQSTVQPRKQYWTIPQLFISYGWGPFGK